MWTIVRRGEPLFSVSTLMVGWKALQIIDPEDRLGFVLLWEGK